MTSWSLGSYTYVPYLIHVRMYVCMCVQALSQKESALREVTEQWSISQLALEEREKELTQVSSQHKMMNLTSIQFFCEKDGPPYSSLNSRVGALLTF